MAVKRFTGKVWVSEDGSWGEDDIIVVDSDSWSEAQREWFDSLVSVDGVTIDAIAEIDKGKKPEDVDDEDDWDEEDDDEDY